MGGGDLLVFRLEHALERRLDVFDRLVDDRIVLDLHALALREIRHLAVRAHVEADDHGLVDGGEVHVVLRDGANTAVDHLNAHLVGDLDLHEGALERLHRTGGVALDHDVEHVDLGLGELLLELLERNHLAALRELGRTFRGLALLGDLACRAVIRSHEEQVACGGHRGEAEHLHRC